jgi:four helix bundle protein
MNNTNNKITTFTDLDSWKEGHKLVLMIYEISMKFPKEEMFGITNQMRRAVVSITSNIAEGFSRYSYKEKIQFYFISLGSVTELQNQLIICLDIKYISKEKYSIVFEQTIKVHKILNGLIKKSRFKTLIPNS